MKHTARSSVNYQRRVYALRYMIHAELGDLAIDVLRRRSYDDPNPLRRLDKMPVDDAGVTCHRPMPSVAKQPAN